MGERTDPMSRGDESTADIRRGIAETQREMSHTIDEIQYRLSPAHMKAQARESVRRAGVKTTRGTIDRVKANPLGAALVGAGIYLLMKDNPNESRYGVEFDSEFDMNPGRDRYAGTGAYAGSQSGYRDFNAGSGDGLTDRARHAAGDMADDIRHKASGMADDVRHKASDMADTAADRARMLGNRAARGARSAKRQGRDLLMDNPFVGGLTALALGAIIGSLIPETDRENELMGEASDRVLHQAGTVASSAVQKAKDVATATASAAKDAATETARRETKNAKDEMQDELGRM